MTKIAPKSARIPEATLGTVLYCEADQSLQAAQSKVFEQAGYKVEHARGRATTEQSLRKSTFDIVILGHTLSKDDRHHLAYMAKKLGPAIQVLVLHASGKHPAVDLAIDSRQGDKAVLAALASLSKQKISMAS